MKIDEINDHIGSYIDDSLWQYNRYSDTEINWDYSGDSYAQIVIYSDDESIGVTVRFGDNSYNIDLPKDMGDFEIFQNYMKNKSISVLYYEEGLNEYEEVDRGSFEELFETAFNDLNDNLE